VGFEKPEKRVNLLAHLKNSKYVIASSLKKLDSYELNTYKEYDDFGIPSLFLLSHLF